MAKDDVEPAAPGVNGAERPGTESAATDPAERSRPQWSRGSLLTLWITLGAMFCGAVAHLIGQALPGAPAYAARFGIGAGVALGAAIGSRRADANDREIARQLDRDQGSSVT